MIDDFSPKRPTQPRPKKPEQLTGFRPSSNLPLHAGDDLLPQQNLPPHQVPVPSAPAPSLQSSPPVSAPIDPHAKEQQTEPQAMELPIKSKRSKKKLLFIPLILLVLGGIGFGAWYIGFRDTGTPQTASIQSTPTNDEVPLEEDVDEEPATVLAPLSGVDVAPEIALRPVTAVMIENSGEARPQSGLLEADVVFEAIAEGGITRFLALYQNSQPEIIGPIRSARPYYAEWAAAFDASYVHAGGSPDGLQRIRDLNVKDVSAFSDSEIFYRTSTRFAPHNLYTSMNGLDQINQRSGFTSSTFTPWDRKKDVAQTPNAQSIQVAISSDFYNVSYAYSRDTNTYLRTMGGEAHVDEVSGRQLAPKVVIVLATSRSQSGIYSVYNTTGTGPAVIFQDGRAIVATWQRTGMKDNYTFTDKYGYPVTMNKGQTWVNVVTSIGDVTFN